MSGGHFELEDTIKCYKYTANSTLTRRRTRSQKTSGSLRSKLEVHMTLCCLYTKVMNNISRILICAIFRPGICKNTICYSGSSQRIRVYNTCLFSISPEPISNETNVYLFCGLHTYHCAPFTRECHWTAVYKHRPRLSMT